MDQVMKSDQIQAHTDFILFQQNEIPEVKKEETLLDLDFDPFKPDVTPAGSAGVTHSPMSQVSSGFFDGWG